MNEWMQPNQMPKRIRRHICSQIATNKCISLLRNLLLLAMPQIVYQLLALIFGNIFITTFLLVTVSNVSILAATALFYISILWKGIRIDAQDRILKGQFFWKKEVVSDVFQAKSFIPLFCIGEQYFPNKKKFRLGEDIILITVKEDSLQTYEYFAIRPTRSNAT